MTSPFCCVSLLSDNMKAITRVSVTTQIVESIKESIQKGQFPIGEKLPSELKLCEMLNVSRSSVREAIRELQAQGFLQLKAGKGAFVQSVEPYSSYDKIREWFISSATSLEDFTEVRTAIEPFAASLACKRATPEELTQLEDIHNQFIEANKINDVELLAKLDEDFHTQILMMSHNELINKISELLLKPLKKYRVLSISAKKNSDNTILEHGQIFSAIQTKDTSAAQQAMLFHLSRVQDGIMSFIN